MKTLSIVKTALGGGAGLLLAGLLAAAPRLSLDPPAILASIRELAHEVPSDLG